VEGTGILRPEIIIFLNDKTSYLKTLFVYSFLESVGLCMLKNWMLQWIYVQRIPKHFCHSIWQSHLRQNTAKSGSYHPVSRLESQESWTRSYRRIKGWVHLNNMEMEHVLSKHIKKAFHSQLIEMKNVSLDIGIYFHLTRSSFFLTST
jgi:hypothetical protein